MKLKTFDDLFAMLFSEIQFIGKQTLALYPKLREKARSQELKDVLEVHMTEIGIEVSRVEHFLKSIKGANAQTSEENSTKSIFASIEKLLQDNSPSPLLDAAIISSVLQIEHAEAAAYSSLEAFADALDLTEIKDFFDESLREVHKVDEILETLAKRKFFSLMPMTPQ